MYAPLSPHGLGGAFLSSPRLTSSTIFRQKTLDDDTPPGTQSNMHRTLTEQVQPLIDEWLASEDGILAELDRELAHIPLAS